MSRAWEPFRPTYLLTILLQDDVGGLQVLMSDKKWVGIRPVQSSFLNIGDTLENRRIGKKTTPFRCWRDGRSQTQYGGAGEMSAGEAAAAEQGSGTPILFTLTIISSPICRGSTFLVGRPKKPDPATQPLSLNSKSAKISGWYWAGKNLAGNFIPDEVKDSEERKHNDLKSGAAYDEHNDVQSRAQISKKQKVEATFVKRGPRILKGYMGLRMKHISV
ncbi:hypothetical protein ACFX14_031873 [Malus domestica]